VRGEVKSGKTVGKSIGVPVRAGGAPLPAGPGADVAVEILSLRPYLANHWREYWFDDGVEAPAQDEMFHPGFYLANGRCWLQGVISWWPTGGTAEGDFDKDFESGLIFTGLPSRFCPSGPTTVSFYVDTVNVGEQWLFNYVRFEATVTPAGSCTLTPRAAAPRLPCGASNDLWLCLDTISWPVYGPMQPVADTLDLLPYQSDDFPTVDPQAFHRGSQIFGGGTAEVQGSENMFRDNVFNAIEDASSVFFPYGVSGLTDLARKVPLPAVGGGDGYIVSHVESVFQEWTWSVTDHLHPAYYSNIQFLSDFMNPPTALDSPSGLSLTGKKHWLGEDGVYQGSPFNIAGDWLAAGCGRGSLSSVRGSAQCRFGITGEAGQNDAIELHLGYGEYEQIADWAGESYDFAAAFGRWIYYKDPLVPTAIPYWTYEMGVATWTLLGVRTDHVMYRAAAPDPGGPQAYRYLADHGGFRGFLVVEAWKDPEPNLLFHIRIQHSYALSGTTTVTFGIGLNPFHDDSGGYSQLDEASHGISIKEQALNALYFDEDGRVESTDFELSLVPIDLDLSHAVWTTYEPGLLLLPGETEPGAAQKGVVRRPPVIGRPT
jgi:hypothetical protein